MASRLLLAKARELTQTGNSEELRLLLDTCGDVARRDLLQKEFDHVLVVKRPNSSNEVRIERPTLLVISVIGWQNTVTECLSSYGEGIDQHVKIWDPTTNRTTCGYSSPLILASMLGKVEMVKSLVNNGADIESTNSLGDNSLLEACFEGNYAVTEFLVQKRASVNKPNERGVTGMQTNLLLFYI